MALDLFDFISLGVLFCLIWVVLYSIYDDFIVNNDPEGRRLRKRDRRERRKQKILQRARRCRQEQMRAGKQEPGKDAESSSSSVGPSSSSSNKTEDSATSSMTEDDLTSLKADAQTNPEPVEKPDGIWQSLVLKVNDFFSDEAVVPESDTDEDVASSYGKL